MKAIRTGLRTVESANAYARELQLYENPTEGLPLANDSVYDTQPTRMTLKRFLIGLGIWLHALRIGYHSPEGPRSYFKS